MRPERRRDPAHDPRRERVGDVDDDDGRGGRAERDPQRPPGRVERQVARAGADLEPATTRPRRRSSTASSPWAESRHERVGAAGRDRGVARLAEPAQDAPHPQRAAVEERDGARPRHGRRARPPRGGPRRCAVRRASRCGARHGGARGRRPPRSRPASAVTSASAGAATRAVGAPRPAGPAHSLPPSSGATAPAAARRSRERRSSSCTHYGCATAGGPSRAAGPRTVSEKRPLQALGEPDGERSLGDVGEARLEPRARFEQPLDDRDNRGPALAWYCEPSAAHAIGVSKPAPDGATGSAPRSSSRSTIAASPTQLAWCSSVPGGPPPTWPKRFDPRGVDDGVELWPRKRGEDQRLLRVGAQLVGRGQRGGRRLATSQRGDREIRRRDLV